MILNDNNIAKFNLRSGATGSSNLEKNAGNANTTESGNANASSTSKDGTRGNNNTNNKLLQSLNLEVSQIQSKGNWHLFTNEKNGQFDYNPQWRTTENQSSSSSSSTAVVGGSTVWGA